MNAERRAELLGHMAQSARLAVSYVEGMSKEDFLADIRTQQAVIMNLIIIGEIATKLLQHFNHLVRGGCARRRLLF